MHLSMLCRRGGDRAWGGDLIVFVHPGVGHLTDLVLPGKGIFESFFARRGDIWLLPTGTKKTETEHMFPSLAKNVWLVDTSPRDTVSSTWRQSRPSCVYSRRKKKNWSPPIRHLFKWPGLFSILLFLLFLWDSFTAMFAFWFTGCDFQLTYFSGYNMFPFF